MTNTRTSETSAEDTGPVIRPLGRPDDLGWGIAAAGAAGAAHRRRRPYEP